ncbi:GNAT family N-acetyltransferase [Microbacterium gorillae]|uniref:GNAT family N-acetyltransferase n=1 Tax=Microbacterium gorillae TaxID=1231063 RepID=UPI00058CEC3B|nr:GNAT family N-acetyltransferase [Microbacterium gorillae]
MDLTTIWPLFGLELRTPRLVLRPTRDDDFPGLVDAAVAGVHDPAVMPFSAPWTDQDPQTLARELARWHWSHRAGTRPEDWTIIFTVLRDGVPIGAQDVSAKNFPVIREVSSGSWLTRSVHGRGLGKEMRAAVLSFAFDHLGATQAVSAAAEWNASSLGVSRALGYVDDGIQPVEARAGEVTMHQRVRLTADAFVRPPWRLDTSGVAAARSFLGL